MLRSSETGMNSAWYTLFLCPVWNDKVGAASCQSQSTRVRSSDPERSRLPSALKLIVLTQPLCFRSRFWMLRDCTYSCAQHRQTGHKLPPSSSPKLPKRVGVARNRINRTNSSVLRPNFSSNSRNRDILIGARDEIRGRRENLGGHDGVGEALGWEAADLAFPQLLHSRPLRRHLPSPPPPVTRGSLPFPACPSSARLFHCSTAPTPHWETDSSETASFLTRPHLS